LLRITRFAKDGAAWLKVEGALAGPWVQECRAALLERGAPPQALDLTRVTFVDSEGLKLLRQLHANGIDLSARSAFVAELFRMEQLR
jgi:hypothetical protein